jgi:hypothetical protein
MNFLLKILIFFLSFSFSFNLLESDVKHYHWNLKNMGEIINLIFFNQSRLAILSGKYPTFGVLNNGSLNT